MQGKFYSLLASLLFSKKEKSQGIRNRQVVDAFLLMKHHWRGLALGQDEALQATICLVKIGVARCMQHAPSESTMERPHCQLSGDGDVLYRSAGTKSTAERMSLQPYDVGAKRGASGSHTVQDLHLRDSLKKVTSTGNHGYNPKRAVLRQEEDCNRRCVLQGPAHPQCCLAKE